MTRLPPSPMSESLDDRLHPRAALPIWAPVLIAAVGTVCGGLFSALGANRAYVSVPWSPPAGGGLFPFFGLMGGFWKAGIAAAGIVVADRALAPWPRAARWAVGMGAAGLVPGPEFLVVGGCRCHYGPLCSLPEWALLTPAGSAALGAAAGLFVSAGRQARWAIPFGTATVGAAWALADGLLGGPAASVLAPGCNVMVLGDWVFLVFVGWAGGAAFGAAAAASSRHATEPAMPSA